jgi:hypothetical protein
MVDGVLNTVKKAGERFEVGSNLRRESRDIA